MRPLARRGARLASSNSIRHSSVSQSRVDKHIRTFTTTAQLSSEPRGSNENPEQHTSFNGWRDTSKTENEPPKQEHAVEQENEDSKYSNEGRKPSVRRSFRQKRVNEVPKPPPIPQWFLDHNVKLTERPANVKSRKQYAHEIRCIDAETGHVLFTVPYYHPFSTTVEQDAVNKTGRKKGQDQHAHSREHQASASKANHPNEDLAPSEAKAALYQNFFDHKFQITKREEPQALSETRESESLTEFTAVDENELRLDLHEWNIDPMRWIYLEAETSVRAAFSVANSGRRNASFAADRVDVSLQCPDPDSHDQMDVFVEDLARITGSDVMRFDVNDFAELTEEYVAQGEDRPGSFSNMGYDVFEDYAATSLGARSGPTFASRMEEDEENDVDEEDEDEAEHDGARGTGSSPFTTLSEIRKALMEGRHDLGKALRARVVGIGTTGPSFFQPVTVEQSSNNSRMLGPAEMNRDDARLDALLDDLLNAPLAKRTKIGHGQAYSSTLAPRPEAMMNANQGEASRQTRINPSKWLPETSRLMAGHTSRIIQVGSDGYSPYRLASQPLRAPSSSDSDAAEGRKTIVHVRDLRDICNNSRLGDTVIRRLVKLVRKRRRAGEQIIIVGTTAQDVPGPFRFPGENFDDFPFRAISVPPLFTHSQDGVGDFGIDSTLAQKSLQSPAYRRILEINLRHLTTMIRRLRPENGIDIMSVKGQAQLNASGMHFLTERVLSMDQIQRLTLTAVGLSKCYAEADVVHPVHISLAAVITIRSDHIMHSWSLYKERQQARKIKLDSGDVLGKDKHGGLSAEARMEQLKKSCNTHESKLLSGVVDSAKISTGFNDVHAPLETIDALKTMTSLSLLRPDAFKYGVLAQDRLPGLLLYGPPGTGKTLLAKAVAKESRATVLEVSGAQVYEKYVGEGEKMVRAVFSLAKKLSPCVVFIDEADAIFGSRSNAGNRNTHREIINQFLREWDGMDDHGVFMMVASNRPFDLDDAVLRRLPRRLLVDLPVAKDRESILGIHLRNEALDSSVSLSKLAEQTPLYSGSDLKNLAVSAALACVREENELAASRKDDKDFKLPEKRTLTSKHFDKALAEISASISEDMSSLTAIRKFDEQYGDRRGRRKKTSYGFSTLDGAVDESAARVRQVSPPLPPPPSYDTPSVAARSVSMQSEDESKSGLRKDSADRLGSSSRRD